MVTKVTRLTYYYLITFVTSSPGFPAQISKPEEVEDVVARDVICDVVDGVLQDLGQQLLRDCHLV